MGNKISRINLMIFEKYAMVFLNYITLGGVDNSWLQKE